MTIQVSTNRKIDIMRAIYAHAEQGSWPSEVTLASELWWRRANVMGAWAQVVDRAFEATVRHIGVDLR